jgi:hypothetical protein
VADNQTIPPEAVAALGAHFGVPPSAVPVLIRLEVQPGRTATGWAATTTDVRGLELTPPSDWPAGQLDLVGALVEQAPDEQDRPFLHLAGIAAMSAYAAQLHIPTGHAMVEVVWPSGPRTSRIELTGGEWTDADLAAAAAAARWLESLPRAGSASASAG